MKKRIVTVLALFVMSISITACGAEKQEQIVNNANQTQSTEEIKNNEPIITEETQVMEEIEEDLIASDYGFDLTKEALDKIESLGVTEDSKKIVAYTLYDDSIVFDDYTFIEEQTSEFYTTTFYRDDAGYQAALLEEPLLGERVETSDEGRYIRDYIGVMSFTSYKTYYESEEELGAVIVK